MILRLLRSSQIGSFGFVVVFMQRGVAISEFQPICIFCRVQFDSFPRIRQRLCGLALISECKGSVDCRQVVRLQGKTFFQGFRRLRKITDLKILAAKIGEGLRIAGRGEGCGAKFLDCLLILALSV